MFCNTFTSCESPPEHLCSRGVTTFGATVAQWPYKELGGIEFAVFLVGLRFSRMWGRTSCEVRVFGAKEGGPYNPFVNLGNSHFAAESPMPALMWSSNLRLCKSCISLLHLFFLFSLFWLEHSKRSRSTYNMCTVRGSFLGLVIYLNFMARKRAVVLRVWEGWRGFKSSVLHTEDFVTEMWSTVLWIWCTYTCIHTHTHTHITMW